MNHIEMSIKSPDLRRYKLIVLDWDGTLVYSRSNVISAMQYVSYRYRNTDWFELDKSRDKNLSLEDNFKNFFNEDKDAAYSDYIAKYISGIKDNVRKIDGSDELLEYLDRECLRKAVVTSKDRKLWELEKGLFNTSFEYSVCKDEAEHNKPAPDALEKVIAHFSVSKDSVLMIGDSVHDKEAAQRAGVDFIILHGNAGLDILVKKILTNLNK